MKYCIALYGITVSCIMYVVVVMFVRRKKKKYEKIRKKSNSKSN